MVAEYDLIPTIRVSLMIATFAAAIRFEAVSSSGSLPRFLDYHLPVCGL